MGSGCGAQLVERSLLTPEIHGLNPVISKLLFGTFTCLLSTVLKRRKQRKEAGNGPFYREKKAEIEQKVYT